MQHVEKFHDVSYYATVNISNTIMSFMQTIYPKSLLRHMRSNVSRGG